MNPFREAPDGGTGVALLSRTAAQRIFVWFGISIAMTTAVVLRLSGLLWPPPDGIASAERS